MFGLAEAKAFIVLRRAKKGKAPDFSEARPYRHGVHPPMPSIFTLCHANRRCQRMPSCPVQRIDAEGRSFICVPITQNGKVVDSQGFMLDAENE
jgi:hypothetical protein